MSGGTHPVSGYSYLGETHPRLAASLARVGLGMYPTPVERLADASGTLWVKREDRAHPVYGGNKLRKLEYLLGQAIAHRRDTVATFGGAGSNHALATAVHARALGLDCIAFLAHQAPTPRVADTLRAHLALGTRLVPWTGRRGERIAAVRAALHRPSGERPPWVIPLGGSSWIGTLGFVSAALELARQVEHGLLPAPDVLYVALGTMGTVAGLAVGLAVAGLPTRIVAVRVVAPGVANRRALARLAGKTATLAARHDPAISPPRKLLARVDVREDQFGKGYAVATPAARAAVDHAAAAWGIALETTYTGKALAALLADREAGRLAGRNVLFWNTYAGGPPGWLPPTTRSAGLPPELERYFD